MSAGLSAEEQDLLRGFESWLIDHSNTVLHRYYHRETLESPLARKTFLLPDRRGEEGETGDSLGLGLGSGADQGPWNSAASAPTSFHE